MSTGVQTAIGRFVWHDLNTTDVATAKDFYTSLFGWETEVWKPGETDYPMIKVNGQMHGGFAPAQGGAPPHWLGNVLVEDVEVVVSRVQGAGGKILVGPMEIPEVGRFAVIQDPQGAVVSAFQPGGPAPENEGVFVWDELLTSDVEGAKRFYAEVFGWSSRDMDMGQMGTYTIFSTGDADRGGCMTIPPGMDAPPSWMAYIGTQDVDATTSQAKELGATALMEPTDIPGDVGRFAVLQDPTGAVFGIYKPGSAS